MEVNYFLIAQRASTRKEVVTTILKLLYNRLGEILSTGKQVSFEFRNVGKLIADRKIVGYQFMPKFSKPFEFRYYEVNSNGKSSKILDEDVAEDLGGNRKISAEDFGAMLEVQAASNQQQQENRQNIAETHSHQQTISSTKKNSTEEELLTETCRENNLTPVPSKNKHKGRHQMRGPPNPKPLRLSSIDGSLSQSPLRNRSFPQLPLKGGNSLTVKVRTLSPLSRSPFQGNLEAVMGDAFSRYEAQVRKDLLDDEEEKRKQLEERQQIYESERRIKQEKLERYRWYSDSLRNQIEEKRQRNEEEEQSMNSSNMFHISQHEADGPPNSASMDNNCIAFPPIIDIDKESLNKEERKRRIELKSFLDKQVQEKQKGDRLLRQKELDQEWKMIEKSKEDLENEKNYLQQKKKDMVEELRSAWTNQLYLRKEIMASNADKNSTHSSLQDLNSLDSQSKQMWTKSV